MTTIVWFRQDLRISDNPALHKALEEGEVVPVYIWSPEEEGNWAPGGASKVWLHESLKSLQKSLKKLGLDLVIRKGPALKTLKELQKEAKADKIYWNRRYEPEIVKRDSKIKSELEGAKSFNGSLLFEPWALEKPYKVFTPFYKACLKLDDPKKPLSDPKKGEGPKIKSLDLEALELMPDIHWEKGILKAWTPGEEGASKRMEAFDVSEYGDKRDRPDISGVSHLSPHLHFGEVSPRQVWHRFNGKKNAEPFLRQLFWREFGYQILYHHPETPDSPLREEWNDFKWEGSEKDLKKWQQGETGYPIVDAGMKELWETGWMHNRVRMIVGSFLVKDLQISWLEGAKWFWDTLVDADLANNTLGWQWVGGCGADAAPYFRIFNPTLQAEKFDPNGDYVKKWIPELKDLPKSQIHTPWESDTKLDYPKPIVDHDKARKRALELYQNLKESS